jgi:hypothetical protein
MYISIRNTKCFNALTGIQATTIYSILQQSRKATVYLKGGDNKGCCVQGYKNHKCNTNEGCTYQGQNNQGLHFTGIAINSRDVFFKDRFMLAPQTFICRPLIKFHCVVEGYGLKALTDHWGGGSRVDSFDPQW